MLKLLVVMLFLVLSPTHCIPTDSEDNEAESPAGDSGKVAPGPGNGKHPAAKSGYDTEGYGFGADPYEEEVIRPKVFFGGKYGGRWYSSFMIISLM